MKPVILHRNNIIRWGLAVILLADVALIGVQWKLNSSPHVQVGELNRLDMMVKQYRADNTRLDRFKAELPTDEKQWDEFFTTHFHPAGAGYSAITKTWAIYRVRRAFGRTRSPFTSIRPTRAA